MNQGRLTRRKCYTRSFVASVGVAAASITGGCVIYVPPLSNADLTAAMRLQPGDSNIGDLQLAFGKPDGLDTSEYKVYYAHHDYGFGAVVIGIGNGAGGGGGEIIRRRDMIVVARLDAHQTLTRLEGKIRGDGIPLPRAGEYETIFVGETKLLFERWPLHFGKVVASKDGQSIVARDANGRLWLRDPQTKSKILDPKPFVQKLEDFSISPDGTKLAMAGKHLVVLDFKSRKPLFRVDGTDAPGRKFSSIVVTDGDSQLFAAHESGVCRWRVSTSEQLPALDLLTGMSAEILIVSSDGQRVAVLDNKNSRVVIWKISTGEIEAQLPERLDAPGDIAFLNLDGSEIAVSYHSRGTDPGGSSRAVPP